MKQRIYRFVPDWVTIRRHRPSALRSPSIGVVIAAVPGTGGDSDVPMGQDHAGSVAQDPALPFDKSIIEGFFALDTAGNAAIGGTFTSMTAPGIRSDAVAAIMRCAHFILGLNPGPMPMLKRPDMFGFVLGAPTVVDCFMLLFGLTGIELSTEIVDMPRDVLLPPILLLGIVTAYAVNTSLTDVYWMLEFGMPGYVTNLYGRPLGPVIPGRVPVAPARRRLAPRDRRRMREPVKLFREDRDQPSFQRITKSSILSGKDRSAGHPIPRPSGSD